MSLEKNKEILYYEMIYRTDDNKQKIFYAIKEEDNVFKMICKPNENKDKKKVKLEEIEEFEIFKFEVDKEYTGDVIRIIR